MGWALYQKLTPHVKVLSEFLFGSLSTLEADFLSKLIELLVQRLESVDLNSPQLIDAEALAQDLDPSGPASSDAAPKGKTRQAALSAAAPASRRPAG